MGGFCESPWKTERGKKGGGEKDAGETGQQKGEDGPRLLDAE